RNTADSSEASGWAPPRRERRSLFPTHTCREASGLARAVHYPAGDNWVPRRMGTPGRAPRMVGRPPKYWRPFDVSAPPRRPPPPGPDPTDSTNPGSLRRPPPATPLRPPTPARGRVLPVSTPRLERLSRHRDPRRAAARDALPGPI